jgi:hypothetical protein
VGNTLLCPPSVELQRRKADEVSKNEHNHPELSVKREGTLDKVKKFGDSK